MLTDLHATCVAPRFILSIFQPHFHLNIYLTETRMVFRDYIVFEGAPMTRQCRNTNIAQKQSSLHNNAY